MQRRKCYLGQEKYNFDRMRLKTKRTAQRQFFSSSDSWVPLQGTLHFTGTQTTGAGVDVTRRPCYNSLYTLNVGFPSPIASTMGMGNLDSESDTLTTDVALSHDAAPP
jgi:hypothetical protein